MDVKVDTLKRTTSDDPDKNKSDVMGVVIDFKDLCDRVKVYDPKLSADLKKIIDDKKDDLVASVNKKKRYGGTIKLYTYPDHSIFGKLGITVRSINAAGVLAYGKRYSDKFKNTVMLDILDSRFTDYVSGVISGKASDKLIIDNDELNEIKAVLDALCKVTINKTDAGFLNELELESRNKKRYGVDVVPMNVEIQTVNVTGNIKAVIMDAKAVNGRFKDILKVMQDDFVNAATDINKIISKCDTYAKDPNSGEYAEIIKKQAQACNKIAGIIQFASSAYCNAFIALSRQNTQTIKNFANGGYKKYEAF